MQQTCDKHKVITSKLDKQTYMKTHFNFFIFLDQWPVGSAVLESKGTTLNTGDTSLTLQILAYISL
jgi:hypothetical protein